MDELPWNEANPEWWKLNVEERSRDGREPWQWLVNEFAEMRKAEAVANAAQRYAEHAGAEGEDADDVCFADLLVKLGEWAEDK
jgi:hypothetical protein